MFRRTVAVALLYLSGLGVAQAETINIWCGNDRFKVDTERNTFEAQGRPNSISWVFDGEWLRLTFANGTDRLAFSSKNGYAIQNGKQIDADCNFINPEALSRIKIAPTANLRLGFIALPAPNRKLIQELMSEEGYYNSTIDGLWGTGTEDALVRYQEYVESMTGEKYQIDTPFGASRYLQAVLELPYHEGQECDGCDQTLSEQSAYVEQLRRIEQAMVDNTERAAARTSRPSFDCGKATTPDERAICASPTLAELDKILNEAFGQVVQNRGQETAQIVARLHLDRRGQCGPNETCIEKVQREAINRFIALGAQVIVSQDGSAQIADATGREALNPEPVAYIQQAEADYILAAIKKFATESPGELNVDFVINLNLLRELTSNAWSDRKAQQFEALLMEIGVTPTLADKISSARADFVREQTELQERSIVILDEKLGELEKWVLNNAISDYAPEIAQFLKRGEGLLLQGNYEEILRTTERADHFLALIASKEPDNSAKADILAAAEVPAAENVEAPEISVIFDFYEAETTLGDAFEQYSAQKGQVLLPVRLAFVPTKDTASISPSELRIELATETGARYPVNEPATIALAAQLGISSAATNMATWVPGEEILLVFEIPQLNTVPKSVHIESEGFRFKPTRE